MKKTYQLKDVEDDNEERIRFGFFGLYLKKSDIEKIYKKRRKFVSKGRCVLCCRSLIPNQGLKCTCEGDLIKFCFQPDLKNRDKEIAKVLDSICKLKTK